MSIEVNAKTVMGSNLVTNGLNLYLDAGISYPGSGTVWNDLSGNSLNATITSGATFIPDGIRSYFTFTALSAIYIPHNDKLSPTSFNNEATYDCWISGGNYLNKRGGLFNKFTEYSAIISEPTYAPGENLYSYADDPWNWHEFNNNHSISSDTLSKLINLVTNGLFSFIFLIRNLSILLSLNSHNKSYNVKKIDSKSLSVSSSGKFSSISSHIVINSLYSIF